MSTRKFLTDVCRMRYGERVIRSLAFAFLDVEAIAAAPDAQLAQLPGVGRTGVVELRRLLELHREKKDG